MSVWAEMQSVASGHPVAADHSYHDDGELYQSPSGHHPALNASTQQSHFWSAHRTATHIIRHPHLAHYHARRNESDGLISAVKRQVDSSLFNLTGAIPVDNIEGSDQSLTSAVYPLSSAIMGESSSETVTSSWVNNISLQFAASLTNSTDPSLTPEPSMRSYQSYQELELLSGHWQIILIALYSLTAALALIGNIIAFWVLMWGKRSSKGTLRIFLVNLSLSDITMATFSIPFTYTDFMLGRWIWPDWFCPVVQCMQMTSVFVSVYTLTAVGIDRYVAIMHPLWSGHFSRIFMPIALPTIWILGFTLGSVQFVKTKALPFLIAGEINYDCKERWTQEQSRAFTTFVFLLTFLLPMVVLSFTYGSIAVKMCNREAPGNADASRDRIQQAAKLKTLKMLATTVICFAFCWAPLHTFNLFIYFGRDFMASVYESSIGFKMYVSIAFISHWLSTANSFVNPIIYSFMSENFKSDLRLLLRKLIRRIPCYDGKSLGSLNTNGRSQQTISTRVHSRDSFYPNHSIKNGHNSTKTTLTGQKITALMANSGNLALYRTGIGASEDDVPRLVVQFIGNTEQCEILTPGTGTECSDPLVGVSEEIDRTEEEHSGECGDALDREEEEAIATNAATADSSSTSTRPLAPNGGQKKGSLGGGSGPIAPPAPEHSSDSSRQVPVDSNGRLGVNSRLVSAQCRQANSSSPVISSQ